MSKAKKLVNDIIGLTIALYIMGIVANSVKLERHINPFYSRNFKVFWSYVDGV